MRSRIFIACISGIIAYIINILIGLVLFRPLVNIFKHGIISFIIIFVLSYIVIYLIEFVKEANANGQQKKREEGYTDGDEQTAKEEDNTNNNDSQFSPMEPPVVEYEEKKES